MLERSFVLSSNILSWAFNHYTVSNTRSVISLNILGNNSMKFSSFRQVNAGFLGVLSLILLTACAPPEKIKQETIRPVRVFVVENSGYSGERIFPAIVSANKKAALSFRVSGELTSIPIASGVEVAAGQELARLDDRDLKNQVSARQADFDLARSEFQRIKLLHDKNVVSESQFENANAKQKAAKVQLQLAKDALTDTILKAPFAGRIATIMVENYQYVRAQTPVLILQDNKSLEIKVQMPESIIGKINVSKVNIKYQPTVTFTSRPDIQFKASYKQHATQVTPGTQSYEVVFSMPTPENFLIYSGMGAIVSFDLTQVIADDSAIKGWVVPITAVLKDDTTGANQVWVYNADNNTVTPRPVTLGKVIQSGVIIESGVTEGEQIVSAGLNRLRSGMKVKLLKNERGV